MAGFAKITLVGEHYGNRIINVLRYRFDAYLLEDNNPYDDGLAFLDTCLATVQAPFLNGLPSTYLLQRGELVLYSDNYTVQNASPVLRSIEVNGAGGSLETTGSIICANVHLQCGLQHQINGVLKSPRNRGYIAYGPIGETYTDSYGHFTASFHTDLENFAKVLDDTLTCVAPPTAMIPIRIHEKWLNLPAPLHDTIIYRTYSDVLGYALPRRIATRKSRLPEA